MTASLEVRRLVKSFTLHAQGGIRLPVLDGVSLAVAPGRCLALDGPSGAGKSTLLRSIYGNYKADSGAVLVRHRGELVDMTQASPRTVLAVRRLTMGYISQFLRVIPRVPTLEVVAEPLRTAGVAAGEAGDRAAAMLRRLDLPERLWQLAPATFSGGEQQRVNIARGFVLDRPVLLLDEPTSALDAENRARVVALIAEARDRGAAMVGIFHDRAVREAVADELFAMTGRELAA